MNINNIPRELSSESMLESILMWYECIEKERLLGTDKQEQFGKLERVEEPLSVYRIFESIVTSIEAWFRWEIEEHERRLMADNQEIKNGVEEHDR